MTTNHAISFTDIPLFRLKFLSDFQISFRLKSKNPQIIQWLKLGTFGVPGGTHRSPVCSPLAGAVFLIERKN